MEDLGIDYILHIDSGINPLHSYLLKKYIRSEEVQTPDSRKVSDAGENAQKLADIICIGIIEDDPELQNGTVDDFQKTSEEDLVTAADLKGKETVADVNIGIDLSEKQEMQVNEKLSEFKDALTDSLEETVYCLIEQVYTYLVCGIKKFQMYLYGKELQVETDHCPLINAKCQVDKQSGFEMDA